MNGWSAAITSEIWAEENESHLAKYSKEIKPRVYLKIQNCGSRKDCNG